MFHPLAPDLSKLKDDELYTKISELTGKINTAWRLGNSDLIHQMQMMMSHYQQELQTRNNKRMEEMEKNSANFKKIIDIK